MTSFLSEWKHIATTKLETKHSEPIAIAQPVELLPERRHIQIVLVKLEKKHFDPIVNAPPVELLSEWNRIVPVEMETKHSEPIATALPVEVPYQQYSRVTPNP